MTDDFNRKSQAGVIVGRSQIAAAAQRIIPQSWRFLARTGVIWQLSLMNLSLQDLAAGRI